MPNTFKNFIFLLLIFLFLPLASFSREYVYDWYIKDFQTEIIVNKDSSLLITEKIIADCDDLPGKHGIFRVLPTQIKTAEGTIIKTPIKLISITDFSNKPLKYSTLQSSFDHTITWKIGDPNKTVTGENYYKITYFVKNAIRFENPQFDELYWNLNGNFWDIEIDNFVGKIIFSPEVTRQNSQVEYYTGFLGEKSKNLAEYNWTNDNTLQFFSTQTLLPKQGITVSVTFPKGIFIPYKPNLIEKYGQSLWFSLPIFVFIGCFFLWLKYGKDPRVNKTVVPEFEIPENISPMEMGMLITSGKFKNDYLTASIISLAVKGAISIEETKSGLFRRKDFLLKDLNTLKNVDPIELIILKGLFWEGKKEVLLSSLRREFYKTINEVKKKTSDALFEKDLMVRKSSTLQGVLYGVATILFFLFTIFRSLQLLISILISAVMITIFSFVMPKRTSTGAELVWKIQGFRLYMETAEKYRQQFYEKENIFEKFLPYAIVFGMTKIWIQKMKEIYGEQYFATYHPVWFVGDDIGTFNVESFTSTMNNISSSIGSNIGGMSGAGGIGGAGGGGGGGGGGGW
jgi:uncharacterized membrane protein YgcG